MSWRRLKRANDWGSIYLAWEDEEARHTTSCAKRALKFAPGQVVKAKMPNGETRDLRVVLREEAFRVHDMGHSYTVYSVVPTFVTVLDGLNITVPVEEIEVWDSGKKGKTK